MAPEFKEHLGPSADVERREEFTEGCGEERHCSHAFLKKSNRLDAKPANTSDVQSVPGAGEAEGPPNPAFRKGGGGGRILRGQ
jgi:hypothetical protein